MGVVMLCSVDYYIIFKGSMPCQFGVKCNKKYCEFIITFFTHSCKKTLKKKTVK